VSCIPRPESLYSVRDLAAALQERGNGDGVAVAQLDCGSAMLVAFLPMCTVRVPREEQVMLDHFRDRYRAYMARTGRAVPRVAAVGPQAPAPLPKPPRGAAENS